MPQLFYPPHAYVPSGVGLPQAGCLAYFYITGTNTPKDTYSDFAKTFPNANPVEADANGVWPAIYMDSDVNYRVTITTALGVTVPGYPQDDVPGPILTSDEIGNALYPIIAQESAAGLTIADLDRTYNYGTRARYKLAADGSADDSTALQNMLKAGFQGIALDFGSDVTIVTAPFTMNLANQNVPPSMTGHSVIFKAKTGSAGVFVTIENPHTAYLGFTTEGDFTFDSNVLCSTAFRLHGSQRCNFNAAFSFRNTVGGPQCAIHAEAGFGVYYNTGRNWQTSHSAAWGGDGNGIDIKTLDGTSRIAGNVWINMHASYNALYGLDMDHCSDTFIGIGIENNGLPGVRVGSVVQIDFLGGYSEFNGVGTEDGSSTPGGYSGATAYVPGDKVKATGSQDCYVCILSTTGNAPPNVTYWTLLGTDTSFITSASTQRLQVYGGRHVGDLDDTDYGTGGLIYMPGSGQGLSLTADGIGFSGGTIPTNGINFSADNDIIWRAAGATKWLWDHTNDWVRNVVQSATTAGAVFGSLSAIDASAALEVKSTTKCLLLPRMTTTQRDAISSPTPGLVIYNSSTGKINVRGASAWEAVTSA